MRRAMLLAILTLTWLTAVRPALAAEYPLTPDPTDCDAKPIDIDRLIELAATGAAASPTPSPTVLTSGRTSAALLEELSGIVVASVACTNANQPLRALSYFTEDYLLHRIGPEPAVTLGHLKAAGTRNPAVAPVEERVTVDSIKAGLAGDGVAYVEVRTTSIVEPTLSSLRLIVTDEGWKIDAVFAAVVD